MAVQVEKDYAVRGGLGVAALDEKVPVGTGEILSDMELMPPPFSFIAGRGHNFQPPQQSTVRPTMIPMLLNVCRLAMWQVLAAAEQLQNCAHRTI